MKRLGVLRRGVSFEDLLVVIGALIGFAWNLQAISDNTAFVHIRTGIDIVNTHHIPHHDAYSFTATGHAWILQSWLAEIIYGVLNAAWGAKLTVLLNSIMLAVVSGGMVWLVRTGRSVLTLLNSTFVLLLCLYLYSTRPTTFGFLMFFLVLATAKRSLWWTVVFAALWINLHGSWPIGVLWLGAVAVGTVLDERRLTKQQWTRLGAFVAGIIVGGVCNPFPLKLLWFPSVAFEKKDVFATIVEWQSPNFHDLGSFSSDAPLIGMAGAVLMMLWLRPKWQHVIPFVGMMAMSLNSVRNMAMFGIGLAAILGVAYRQKAEREAIVSKPISRKWGPIEVFAIVVLSFVALFQVVRLGTGPQYGLGAYPVAGIAYAKQLGYWTDQKRVYAPDFVGCLRILQDGKNAEVFIDDRYDMYPLQVSYDSRDISHLNTNVEGILNQYNVAGVMYPKDRQLATFLANEPNWTLTWSDKNWAFYTRK